MLSSALAWVVPFLLGFFFSEKLGRGFIPGLKIRLFMNVFIAFPLGAAIVSGLFFLWSWLFYPGYRLGFYLALEVVVLLILCLVTLPTFVREIGAGWRGAPRLGRVQPFNLALAVFAAGVFLIFLFNFIEDTYVASVDFPFGHWDAMATWNLRARFMETGIDWKRGFTPLIDWTHPDYPLLLSAFIARTVLILGTGVPVSILVGAVFYGCLAGASIAAVMMVRGFTAAMIAGVFTLVVLSVGLEHMQYSDVPLALFFFLGNFFFFLRDISRLENARAGALIGFLVGCMIWTKNEGWAMAVSFTAPMLAYDLGVEKLGWLPLWKTWKPFALGLAFFLSITALFKFTLAPSNDLVRGVGVQAGLARLFNPARARMVLKSLLGFFFSYGTLRVPLIPGLCFYPFIVGFEIPTGWKKGVYRLGIRLATVAAAYFGVYLLTPHDLQWHLDSSMDRLITQLMPSFLLLIFLVAAHPRVSLPSGKGEN